MIGRGELTHCPSILMSMSQFGLMAFWTTPSAMHFVSDSVGSRPSFVGVWVVLLTSRAGLGFGAQASSSSSTSKASYGLI